MEPASCVTLPAETIAKLDAWATQGSTLFGLDWNPVLIAAVAVVGIIVVANMGLVVWRDYW